MQIQIDVSQMHVLNADRGVGMYTSLLFEHLKKNFPDESIELLHTPTSTKADLVHYPYFDLYFHTLPIRKRAKTVVTIHDVIPLIYPKQYRPGIRGSLEFFRQLVSLKAADAVITDSECSKQDIAKHFGFPAEKIHVVYLAGNPQLKAQKKADVEAIKTKYSLPKDYVLYIGDINYNKNLPAFIQACAALPKGVDVVMVGHALKNTAIPEGRALNDAIQNNGMIDRVTLLTDIPKEPASELASILSGAMAYVQPSLYEGFGLSVLDAMQCEVPVVTSRTSSLREVAGDAAIYFHPKSVDEMTEAIKKAIHLSAKEKKDLLAKAAINLKKFSWDKAAIETHAVYTSVIKV